ncbi:MAG TPA: isochorismatase family protein [Lachnospiraceae bacterium]|jgi:nicotinamidase-related amidase|nr:isochorismatase family protein [Lachnospiraceae bacterium]
MANKNALFVINMQDYVSPFAPGLLVVSDYCFEKGRASAFSEEALLKLLQDKGIEAIEVIGIDGNCCVATTALEAQERGFSVVFPLQYVGIKSMQRFERTREKLVKAGVGII